MGKHGLGEFELLVLLAVLRLGDEEAHTLAIVDDIAARTGRKVQRAAVYVTLQRLETKQMVGSWLAEPRPERRGKPRRHYRLQPPGVKAARHARDSLRRMWSGLESALGSR